MNKHSILDYTVPSIYSYNDLKVLRVSEEIRQEEITHFRYAEFSGLFYNLSGEIEYWVEGRIHETFAPGHYQLIHTPCGSINIKLQPGKVDMILLYIPADYMEVFIDYYPKAVSMYCAATQVQQTYTPFERPKLITPEMKFPLNVLWQFDFVEDDLNVQICNALIFDLVLLHLSPTNHPYEWRPNAEIDPVMVKMKELLENLSCDWTPDTLADAMAMHKRSLTSKFKATFGVSPMRYLREVRLKHSVTLLNQGMSVNDVAKKVGYRYHQHFDRAFKRYFNCSPLSITRKAD